MTKKFTNTITDDVRNTARNINDGVLTAFDVKKKDIEEKYIPKKTMTVLTPEEVRRAEVTGLAIGGTVLIVALIVLIWWLILK